MRAAFKKLSQRTARFSTTTAVSVVSQRHDLTRKWIQRIQNKVRDAASSEAYGKISSLIDYYNKPPTQYKEDIDWNYWRDNIRTEGVVEKIQDKLNEYKSTQNYNIDNIAMKSVINSEKYETYGMFLEYNHNIWMQNYLDNITTLIDSEHLGDINYVGGNKIFKIANEFMYYVPGGREIMAGWRETGNILRIPNYCENSMSTIIRRQFRFSNRSWQPYWHPVYAWERGVQIKHVLMSL